MVVRPSLIRVEADEVTYNLHVMMRFDLERAVVQGSLRVADLPAAWNDRFEQDFGIRPTSDANGVLQDIHWSGGLVGYFPTYTLGAMTAAQLFDAAKRADASIVPSIGKGDFSPLMAWLRTNVHAKASSLGTDALLVEATGKKLDVEIFKAHLKARYLET